MDYFKETISERNQSFNDDLIINQINNYHYGVS
jgi:hypothetical protein